MEIIDFHTHTDYDYHLADHGVVMDSGRFRDDLLACGITRACGSVIYTGMTGLPVEQYETLVPKLNDRAVEIAEELGGFYIPGIHVHPQFLQMSLGEIERAHRCGIRLIGELVPGMMSHKNGYFCENFMEMMHLAAEFDMVVSLHPYGMKDMYALSRALRDSLPRLKVVWAHLNGSGELVKQLELMEDCPNLYYDTSAHGCDMDGTLRYAIDRVGHERILFGTDYPGVQPACDVAGILAEPLTDAEREAILAGNAKRLLGLE
ncbi:MAG: amidohydrolase [Ruminococcaceae bacterium]|nr:amidohydrolase [Oscillospiraceae bacterium]